MEQAGAWWFCLYLVYLFFLGGCLGTSGNLRLNSDLLVQYKEAALPKDYNYYYCGRSGLPYAVVGIDASYKLHDRFWFKIEAEKEIYKKIGNLSQLHPDTGSMVSSDILNKEGKKIGVWFSYYRYTPVRVDPETRMVAVFNPYNPNEDHKGSF